jgi:hypothetical protein
MKANDQMHLPSIQRVKTFTRLNWGAIALFLPRDSTVGTNAAADVAVF